MRLSDLPTFQKVQAQHQKAYGVEQQRVRVCCGTGCIGSGSLGVLEAFQKEVSARKLKGVEVEAVKRTGCHGFCAAGPLVIVEPDEILYCKVKVKDVTEIVTHTLIDKTPLKRLLYKNPATKEKIAGYREVPFFKSQKKLITRNIGQIDPENIEEALSVGVYSALVKALFEKSPQEVVEEVKKSGLRGRGGAGFPAGRKWEICREAPSTERVLICNADEGDPGAFMDRSVMEGDPHSVLEGMLIGAYAVGAQEGYIYVREEYPLAVSRLARAIEQATESGLLGEKILGRDFSFHVSMVRGGGAFVCGEETALIASIQGRVGEPRPRPPYPVHQGVWGKPTCINNVETWATVPHIMKNGHTWFSSIGTKTSKGTKIFSLVGKVNNTGLIEVPMGITLREIIFEIGGGISNNKKFKAVQTGGPSGGCLPASMLDVPVDYETLTQAGSMMGSGGMIVMDERTCMVDMTRYFLKFLMDESCGKCLPCREGVPQLHAFADKICRGKGKEEDLKIMERLAEVMASSSLCGLGKTAPNPLLSTLRHFRSEYDAHIREKKCPAGICTDLVTYEITDDCLGCVACYKACPVEAIKGGETKVKHEVIADKCIKCGACYDVCTVDAVAVH